MDMRFRLWLEEQEGPSIQDSNEGRKTLIAMLGLTLNNDEGQHIELRMLPLKQMADKLDGQDYWQKMNPQKKGQIEAMLMMPNHKTLKDLLDLMLSPNLEPNTTSGL